MKTYRDRAFDRKPDKAERRNMKNVTVAETAGFCFGVDRAVKIVYNKLKAQLRFILKIR